MMKRLTMFSLLALSLISFVSFEKSINANVDIFGHGNENYSTYGHGNGH